MKLGDYPAGINNSLAWSLVNSECRDTPPRWCQKEAGAAWVEQIVWNGMGLLGLWSIQSSNKIHEALVDHSREKRFQHGYLSLSVPRLSPRAKMSRASWRPMIGMLKPEGLLSGQTQGHCNFGQSVNQSRFHRHRNNSLPNQGQYPSRDNALQKVNHYPVGGAQKMELNSQKVGPQRSGKLAANLICRGQRPPGQREIT